LPVNNKIDQQLKNAMNSNKVAIATFMTTDYPDHKTFIDINSKLCEIGVDILEFGIPFSDPIAEGPTIQKTTFKVIQNGTNINNCFESISFLRTKGYKTPIVIMGYYNPILKFGLELFTSKAREVGIDGLVVADLPIEESNNLRNLCNNNNIHLIQMLAPTSTLERIKQTCEIASGFIYCVSLTGVTGARKNIGPEIQSLANKIRKYTKVPIMVGFGISSHVHVKTIGGFADGAIIGSALLDAVGEYTGQKAVSKSYNFVKTLINIPSKQIGVG
jgi:tryptophan synthase alpha chain